jgi:hypothetical protein
LVVKLVDKEINMSETLKGRLDNLEMFLHELTENRNISAEVKSQANYHLATMEILRRSQIVTLGKVK